MNVRVGGSRGKEISEKDISFFDSIFHKAVENDILDANEKQAAAKLTFVFHASVTSKRPMKSDRQR